MHQSEIHCHRSEGDPETIIVRARGTSARNISKAANDAALTRIRSLAQGWLVTTHMSGDNLMALDPKREDRHVGSFSINIRTGLWADFATGDIVSFYAFRHGARQIAAARELARILGVKQ